MKRTIKFIVSGAALLLPGIVFGASIYTPALAILPDPPRTTSDNIYAQAGGDFASPGYTLDGAPAVTITGSDITIGFYWLSPAGPGPFVLTPFLVDADIGLLGAGTYNVAAGLYVDGILEHALSDSFSVTAVPIPAAVWLFGSGLMGMAALARLRNVKLGSE